MTTSKIKKSNRKILIPEFLVQEIQDYVMLLLRQLNFALLWIMHPNKADDQGVLNLIYRKV